MVNFVMRFERDGGMLPFWFSPLKVKTPAAQRVFTFAKK
jgi:hypothetical protein